ncbi:MAG TPA: sigma-70 factor domain-containing protein, partial [Pseudonocardiaceae bacterium]|nr:sigma-70 factor domain-containing protein [Pseudonocardiaceae bacterium]
MDRCERAYVAAAETATRRSSTAVSAAKTTRGANGTDDQSGADANDVNLDGVADTATPIKKTATKKPAARKTTTAKKPAAKKDGAAPAKPRKEGNEAEIDMEGDVSPEDADLEDVEVDLGEDVVEEVAVEEETTAPPKDAKDGDFVWDEEESEALRQARKDAELTASADSVRAYLKQIGKVALLNAEEEVELAKRIEAGLYAAERVR